MALETTLGVLVEAEQALVRLCAIKFPMKVAYRISKLGNKIRRHVKHFHDERQRLMTEMSQKKQAAAAETPLDAAPTLSDTSAFDAFKLAMEQLYETPVTVDGEPLLSSDLMATEFEITPADLMALDVLLVEDAPVVEAAPPVPPVVVTMPRVRKKKSRREAAPSVD